MTGWHAVDAEGRALATGRPPKGAGFASPEAALAAAPVAAWPMGVVDGNGRYLSLAEALGPGGERVGLLLERLAVSGGDGVEMGERRTRTGAEDRQFGLGRAGGGGLDAIDVETLASATPAGPVSLPLAVVSLQAGVEVAGAVDPVWLAEVERRRAELRRSLVAAGREAEMEAALHVAVLLGTERLDPVDDTDVDAHVASGAQLWLLAGAVVSALAATGHDAFEGWGRLVATGWWPIGPSGGCLVVCAVSCSAHAPAADSAGAGAP